MSIDQTVFRGENFWPIVTVRDSSGSVVDLTSSTVSLVMRLKRGSDTVITRTKGVSGETSYPASGTDGRVQFLFSPAQTAAMTVGLYQIQLVYQDTASDPDTKQIIGEGSLSLVEAATAPI